MTGQHQCCCDCRRSEVSMLCCCGERRSKVSMLCCVADVAFCQAEMFRFEQLPLCFFLAALPNELAHAGRASMLSVCCAPAQIDADPEAGEDALVRALRKAIESGDTNLVLLVMFHIYQIRPLQVSGFVAYVYTFGASANLSHRKAADDKFTDQTSRVYSLKERHMEFEAR
eukprot:scaffold53769_cov17-Tisochrysis_lutea.AAC.1